MLTTLGVRSFYAFSTPELFRAALGSRMSFSAAAPTLWKSLPAHIRKIESFGAFKKHVKTSF